MTNVNDNVRISDNIGVVASSSSKQLSSIRTLSLPFFILNILFPTSSLKMTFPSLNLEMKVGVCITCEESKSLPSLVGKVKKKI
jgi:hypothetical protein